MHNISFNRNTRNLENFIKKIRKLSESKVESGYFQEQGNHPESKMSYADLAELHSKGEGKLLPRDVRMSTTFDMKFKSSVRKHISRQLKDYLYNNIKLSSKLDSIGWKITGISQSYFGEPSIHNPPNSPEWAKFKGANTPLVYKGFLVDAWSWRTSENSQIRST